MTNTNGRGGGGGVAGLQRNGSGGGLNNSGNGNSSNGGGGDNASVSSGSNHSNGNGNAGGCGGGTGAGGPNSRAAKKRQRRRNKKKGSATGGTATTTTPEFVTIEEEYNPTSPRDHLRALLVRYGGVILVPLISLALMAFTAHWFEGDHPPGVSRPEVFVGQPAPLPDFARPRVYDGDVAGSRSSSASGGGGGGGGVGVVGADFDDVGGGVDVGGHWADRGRAVPLDAAALVEDEVVEREVVTSTEVKEDTFVDENGDEVTTTTTTTTTHLTTTTTTSYDGEMDDEGGGVGGGTPMSAVLLNGARDAAAARMRRLNGGTDEGPKRPRPRHSPPDPADYITPRPRLCSDGVTLGYSDWNSLRSAVHSLNDFNDARLSSAGAGAGAGAAGGAGGVYSDGGGGSSYYGLPDLPGGTHNAVTHHHHHHHYPPPHTMTRSTHPEAIPEDRGQQQRQKARAGVRSHSTTSHHYTHRVITDGGEEVSGGGGSPGAPRSSSSSSPSPRYYTEWDDDDDDEDRGGYYHHDDDDDAGYYDDYHHHGEEEPIPPPPFVICPGTTIQSTGWTSSLIRLGSSFGRPMYSSSHSHSHHSSDGNGNTNHNNHEASMMGAGADRGRPIYVDSEDVTLECDACVVHLGGTHLSFGPNARNVVVRGWTFVGARTSSLTFHHHGAEATFEDCTWMGNSGLANGGAVADLNSTSSVSFFRCEISDSKQAPRVVNGHGNTPVVGSSLTIRN